MALEARPILHSGAGAGLLSALLFGLSTPVSKLLLPESGPFMVAGLLYLGAGLGLAALAPLRRTGREARLQDGDMPALVGMIVAGGVVGPVLLLFGLSRTSGAAASLLLNLETPLTIAVAVLVLREPLDHRELGATAAILGGGALLALGPERPEATLTGALAVAGACLAWAIDNNLGQRLSGRDPVAVARAKALAAAVVNGGIAFSFGERLPRAGASAAILVTGLLGYGVSVALYQLAMRHLGAARQAAFFATAPFVGALASIPILGDRVTGRLAGAGALMLGGVATLLRARHGHRHTHEALEHEHAHVHDGHHADHGHGASEGPHSHRHVHAAVSHDHAHLPDLHHRHRH